MSVDNEKTRQSLYYRNNRDKILEKARERNRNKKEKTQQFIKDFLKSHNWFSRDVIEFTFVYNERHYTFCSIARSSHYVLNIIPHKKYDSNMQHIIAEAVIKEGYGYWLATYDENYKHVVTWKMRVT